MRSSDPDRPHLSAGFYVALVLAVLGVLLLGAGSPRMPRVSHTSCSLHLKPMAPSEAPSTWGSWPSSRDVTEMLRNGAKLDEPRSAPAPSWSYLAYNSVDPSLCPDDARLFSQAARPAGQAPAVRVVSDSEASRFLAISAAPEHVVAAFHADWHDDSYVDDWDGQHRFLMAEDFQGFHHAWIAALVALLLGLLPLAFVRRVLDRSRYVPGRLGPDGELSVGGSDGERESVAPHSRWRASGFTGAVLVSLVSLDPIEPVVSYRDAATRAPLRRARAIVLGTREEALRGADRASRTVLGFLAVICLLAWLVFQLSAIFNDWPNC